MIGGSAAYAVVWWALAQVGSPDAGTQESTPAVVSPAQPGDAGAEAPIQDPSPAAVAPDGGVPAQEMGPISADPDAIPEAEPPQAAPPVEPPAADRPKLGNKPKPTPRSKVKRPNTATFNLAAAALGIYSVALERVMIPQLAILLEGGIVQRDFATTRGTSTVSGFAFSVSGRYFPFGEAPNGLYVGPDVTAYNLVVREAVANARGTSVGFGAWVGYNFTFFQWLHIAPAVGGNVTVGPVGLNGILYRGSGLTPLARLGVGFAF
ncbi:MAG: hypothetical protein M3Y59_03310 [Myxococcota bacterium]|nr:hypothetical protein [Myxococcota bacterium]